MRNLLFWNPSRRQRPGRVNVKRPGLRAVSAAAIVAAVVSAALTSHAAPQVNPSLLQADFPYTTACIGAKGPEKNLAYKGIAIRLANSAYMCFDTDLLRMSAGWTGEYITTSGVAFDGSHGGHPQVAGTQKFATKMSPGWADEKGGFADNRPEPYGPLSESSARWNGLYVFGDSVVLSYTVLGHQIYEQPSSVTAEGEVGFVRTFRLPKTSKALRVVLSDAAGAQGQTENGKAILSTADGSTLVAGLVGAPAKASLEVLDGNRIVLNIPAGTKASTFSAVVWNGAKANSAKFDTLLKSVTPEIANFKKGGPARWTQTVTTKGVVGNSDGAFAVDNLTPPVDNPWKRRVRFGAFDFFKDGKRAAVCTWDGDIWIVSGIDDKLENLTWKRFASGGYETLGLKIVNDVIYTSGRDQITRYYDFNKDGEADYYENFNNQITSSTGFHEFVFDLQTDPSGNFYLAKAGPVRGGGRGFGGGGGNGEITAHAGTVLRVSKDGKKLNVYATGFRAPNGIGVSPTGQVTTGDNEGTWVPTCPINWVEEGGFYGVEDLAHRSQIPEFKKPLCWLDHRDFDNSGGGQVWVTSDKWAPLKGELLHLSYGQCALYLVLKEKVGNQMQGGVVRIPATFTSSAMRGRFNPVDGQLYISGLQGWQTKAAKISGLDRVRYTGKPLNSVTKLNVTKEGIKLTFSEALSEKEATDLQNYSAKRWNYRRSKEYGSPELHVSNPQKSGRENVEITGAKLSPDGKTVTLQVDDLRPVDQMLIRYTLKTKSGAEIDQQVEHTIHAIQ